MELQLSKELISQLESEKLDLKQQRPKELDHLRDFLQQLTGSQNVQSLPQLFANTIDRIATQSEAKVRKSIDDMENRLKQQQQALRRFHLLFQKVSLERLFYKDLKKLRQQSMHSVDQFTVKAGVNMFRGDDEEDEVMSIITMSQQNHHKSSSISTVLKKGGSLECSSDSSNEKENRSPTGALSGARELIQYRQDKNFIDKVLDAQMRVNQIEQRLKKSTTPTKKSFDFNSLRVTS